MFPRGVVAGVLVVVLVATGCSIPTVPTGDRAAPPVSPPIGDGTGRSTGPRDGARGEDAARAAAVAAVSATGEIAKAGFISRDDLITSIASSGFADELAAESARQLDELSVELGEAGVVPAQLVWSELPLRARVRSHSATVSSVQVWSVLVVGVPGHGAPRQVWRTVTVGLVWERQGWRVDAWRTEPGPTPALAAASTVSSVDEVSAVLAWPPVGGS